MIINLIGNLEDKASPHGRRGRGSLLNGSLQVLLRDSTTTNNTTSTTLDPDLPLFIPAYQEYSIILEFIPSPTSDLTLFKGFLFRLSGVNDESVDGTLYVADDDKVQELNIGCASTVSAMTHTNNNGKTRVEFNFQYFDEVVPISLLLEVTVVIDREPNNWFYDEYQIEIGDDDNNG